MGDCKIPVETSFCFNDSVSTHSTSTVTNIHVKIALRGSCAFVIFFVSRIFWSIEGFTYTHNILTWENTCDDKKCLCLVDPHFITFISHFKQLKSKMRDCWQAAAAFFTGSLHITASTLLFLSGLEIPRINTLIDVERNKNR